MRKLSKIIPVILTMMMLIVAMLPAFSNAAGIDPSTINGTEISPDGVNRITNFGNQIVTILSTVASVISVIVLIVIGIKYMMGSAEEKAEYKKTMMPYIVGAAVVFMASTIAGILYSFFTSQAG